MRRIVEKIQAVREERGRGILYHSRHILQEDDTMDEITESDDKMLL